MFSTHQLKETAEKIIPKKYLREAGLYAMRVTIPLYQGNSVECPCCKRTFSAFASYGQHTRENILCRWCLSLERHRGLWLYFHQKTNLPTTKLKVLHFAPEHQFQKWLKNASNIDYISADLDMPTAMVKMDITNITFDDNTFDVVICNHVLEHIPDDTKAMSELYRVLKPGGWAVLETPMLPNEEYKTREDLTITDPQERIRLFHQADHVRIYGMDKKERLEKVGFEVDLDRFVLDMDEELVERYRLAREYIWIGRKN